MKKTKIKGRYVIGYNGTDHVLYQNGEVVYEGNTILYVGTQYTGMVDEVIQAGNAIISPGFIDLNALGDIDHDILHLERPSERSKMLLWSKEYFYNREECMSKEEEAFKSLYAYTQLILSGITTAMPITSVLYKKWAETYEEIEAAVHHAGKLGLRLYIGPSYQYGTNVVNPDGTMEVLWDEEEGRKGLERAVQFIRNYDGAYDGLIKGALEPERIENQTVESLKETKKYSQELNCPIKLHASQGSFEYSQIQNNFGMSPVQFLDSIGFLGDNVGIPHCHVIAGSKNQKQSVGNDVEILERTKTTVIHCPLIFGRYGEFLDSFAKYKSQGVSLAIGTDTFPPDFFQNIRIGSAMGRMAENESVENSSYADFYRAATLGGAGFLKREDLGRLCAGAKADMIVIDLDGYHMGPIDDPIRTMMINGSRTDITMSIINGRVVMKDRKIPGIDLVELQRKAQIYYEKMKLTYLKRSYINENEESFYTSSFPLVN